MARNKNHSINVDISKIWNFLKENKVYAFAIIIIFLTVRVDLGWKDSKFNFNLGCDPLSIKQVKQIATLDEGK